LSLLNGVFLACKSNLMEVKQILNG